MKVRSAVPSLALLLTLVACADAPVDPGDGGIDHSNARDQVLVRVSFEGGFTPVEWTYTSFPIFSLYGDGMLVLPGAQIELYPGPALPAISSRPIEEPGIQAILEEALAAMAEVPADLHDLGFMGIADAPTTVISVSADGVNRTIRAYALGELSERPDGMPEEEYRARLRLQELVTKLGTLDPWLPVGSLGPEAGYEASAARLFVGPYRRVDNLPQEPTPWPLEEALESFGSEVNSSEMRCGVVEGGNWGAVREAASQANELTPWTDAGTTFSILFRPLLPDETSCEPAPALNSS
jgi:hypothetical protein